MGSYIAPLSIKLLKLAVGSHCYKKTQFQLAATSMAGTLFFAQLNSPNAQQPIPFIQFHGFFCNHYLLSHSSEIFTPQFHAIFAWYNWRATEFVEYHFKIVCIQPVCDRRWIQFILFFILHSQSVNRIQKQCVILQFVKETFTHFNGYLMRIHRIATKTTTTQALCSDLFLFLFLSGARICIG